MRRGRTDISRVSFIEVDQRRGFRRLIPHRRALAFCALIPVAITGVALQNGLLVMIPVMIALGMAFRLASEAEAETPARPIRVPDSSAFLPPATLLWQAKVTAPAPEPMFVGARHPTFPYDWYHGGGIGLTRHGVVTANDGRNQAGAWEVRSGTAPVATPSTGEPPFVAELAVVGHRGFIRRIYLRDEHGRILASLPAAGLDGRRLSALARAAGIRYCRYEAAPTIEYGSRLVAVDCFRKSPSYVSFNGPVAPVAEDVWTVGEGGVATP